MSGPRRYWNESVLAPTDVKVQHYVPQWYLRVFADTRDQVRVVDFDPPGRGFRTSVRNAAAESRFYDVDVGGTTLSTEGWLAELEGNAVPVVERLVGYPGAVLELSVDEEMALARFLAAFRFRTPAFRDQMRAMQEQMVAHAKELMHGYVRNKYSDAEAEQILSEWADQPDEWWLANARPDPPAATTAAMLAEVQGWANLLWAMPWRVGRVPPERRLYTSDNPVAGRLPPVRPWSEGGAFASLRYFVPLSPDVLLQIDPLADRKGAAADPRGSRRHRDFDTWQATIALYVVSTEARRFVYGDAPVIPRERASERLAHQDGATLAWAMVFLGHDPRPPRLSDGPDGEPRWAGPR